jgi:hypothetical protein
MLLSQIMDHSKRLRVVVREGTEAYALKGSDTVYDLATGAAREGKSLAGKIHSIGFGEAIDLEAAYAEGRILLPVMHRDPAHMHVTGTGLTHLGSASTRDAMHKTVTDETKLTDSMKMFRMGIEGGKPADDHPGVQPEWFYKGNGTMAVAPGSPLVSPGFAEDGG